MVADLIFRRTSTAAATVALAGLVVTGILVLGQIGASASIFGSMLAVDPLAVLFKLVILLTAILVTVFSLHSGELQAPGRKMGEYYALLLGLTLGLMLMAGASNLLMMYLALELSSLSLVRPGRVHARGARFERSLAEVRDLRGAVVRA